MAYVEVASGGVGETWINISVKGLQYPSNNYARIELIVSNGARYRLEKLGYGGGTTGDYRTLVQQVSGLSPGTSYTFRAEIQYYSTSTTENTGSISQSTLAPAIPAPSVYTSGETYTSLQINWFSVSGASSYQVEFNGANYYTSNTYMQFTGLTQGTSYRVRVRGYSGSNYGTWSSYITASTTTLVVGQVTGLATYVVTPTEIGIAWNVASNASSYQIELNGSYYYPTGTTHKFINLVPNTTYTIRVRGYQGTVYGAWSSTITVVTTDSKPARLNWPVFYQGSYFSTLTATLWNGMTTNINEWKEYQKKTKASFDSAWAGRILSAQMFNKVVDELNTLNPPIVPPQKVVTAEKVTTAKINRIADSINSLQ